MSHQEQAERLAFGVVCEGFDCGTFDGDDGDDLCVKCQAYAAKIRAALDAAAREALREAAEASTSGAFPWTRMYEARDFASWLRARADALSGRHKEETKR